MDFNDKVYRLCRKIPKGKVSTYKELANALGTKAYRAVGQAMRRNPYAPEVPCHRVVASDGSLGGFDGKWTTSRKKIALLKDEGVKVEKSKVKEFKKKIYRF